MRCVSLQIEQSPRGEVCSHLRTAIGKGARSVFAADGKFKQEWRLDGSAWSLCITPGPRQVIFVGSIGRVYKLDLEGNVAGKFGKLGRLPDWFDSIHALARPDEKTLYIANEFSYRFDKVVLQ